MIAVCCWNPTVFIVLLVRLVSGKLLELEIVVPLNLFYFLHSSLSGKINPNKLVIRVDDTCYNRDYISKNRSQKHTSFQLCFSFFTKSNLGGMEAVKFHFFRGKDDVRIGVKIRCLLS